jgi:hypothetical protein
LIFLLAPGAFQSHNVEFAGAPVIRLQSRRAVDDL